MRSVSAKLQGSEREGSSAGCGGSEKKSCGGDRGGVCRRKKRAVRKELPAVGVADRENLKRPHIGRTGSGERCGIRGVRLNGGSTSDTSKGLYDCCWGRRVYLSQTVGLVRSP